MIRSQTIGCGVDMSESPFLVKRVEACAVNKVVAFVVVDGSYGDVTVCAYFTFITPKDIALFYVQSNGFYESLLLQA